MARPTKFWRTRCPQNRLIEVGSTFQASTPVVSPFYRLGHIGSICIVPCVMKHAEAALIHLSVTRDFVSCGQEPTVFK